MTPIEEAHFIQLWQAGTETAAIAQALGCPVGTVSSRAYALRRQGKIAARPMGGAYPKRVRQAASPHSIHPTVQSGAEAPPRYGAEIVQGGAEHRVDTGAVQVQSSAERPIPAAIATELARLWAAIDALRQDMHRPVQATVQSLPEPLFDNPTDNATERWNLYLKHGLRVRIEAVAQARGVAASRVVQELLWQALTDRRSPTP
jgi:hypothetical protein